MITHPHPDCATCNAYLARREAALPAAVVHYARKRKIKATDLMVEFVRGVHRRHEAGLSLAVDQ